MSDWNAYLFTCVVCQRDVRDFRERRGPDKQVAPVCRCCEREYGDRAPAAGSFMDRRRAVQLAALGNALRNRASVMQWERDHASA